MSDKRKVKVLHVQLLPLLSGVQRVTLNEIIDLKSDDYDYDYDYDFDVCCNGMGPFTEILDSQGIKYSIIPSLKREINGIYDFKAMYQLYRLMRQNKYDIVHTHSSKTGFLGRIAAKVAGVKKVVHTVHGFSFPAADTKFKKSVFFFMEWFAKFFTDNLIVLNEVDNLIAIKKLRFDRDKVAIIPNGVNTQLYYPSSIPSENFNIVMLGRLWKQKNPLCLLYATKNLIEKYPDLNLTFIGDGELKCEMEKYISAHQLQSNIKLLGWKNNIENLLPEYDLFVLPSLWEGMPLAILEAQSCGLPCVVSNIPGNNSLVKHGFNGLLFESDDYMELATSIEQLYKNRKLLNEMAINSRDYVEKMYSNKKRNASVISLYNS